MTKTKKTICSFLLGLVAAFALCFGVVLSIPQTPKTASAAGYTVKETSFMAYIDDVYAANGNFYLYITTPDLDTTTEAKGVAVDTSDGDMPTILKNFDFYNKVKINGYTLAELGCTGVWENAFDVNSGGGAPKYKFRFHMHADPTTWNAAIDAGKVVFGVGSNVTISEGALIPGYQYLTGDHTATVFRAGCDFVSTQSDVAYNIQSVGKTDVVALDYVTGWDATYNNSYLGISLKGDDYAGNGSQLENNPNYGYENKYFQNILVDGVAGKVEQYGLFNLGSKGQGMFSFVIRAMEEESETITIPAGTCFPARAMATLREVNGNPVYIYYETQSDITFYKQADGSWALPMVEKETTVTKAETDGASDYFVLFHLDGNDYGTDDTYRGDAVKAADWIQTHNFFSYILLNDTPLTSSGEAFINVWNNHGTFGIRGSQICSTADDVNKITILAGCQFPTRNALATGANEAFVTQKDVTYVKQNGEWVVYVPEGEFATSIQQVQYGRDGNSFFFNLTDKDYPKPENDQTWNIPANEEKVAALNLYDKIVIDNYTVRALVKTYGAPTLYVNRYAAENFAIRFDNGNFEAQRVIIKAGAQFPSLAYLNNGANLFYVTNEEIVYVATGNENWEREYKVTFKADGKVVATIPYTVGGGMDGEAPEVPAKEGFKGKWSTYSLTGGNIVVEATYTAHSFTEKLTNVSKLQYEEGFVIIHLTNNDYPTNAGTIAAKARMAAVHLFDYMEVDGKQVTNGLVAEPRDAFVNVWNRYGSLATYLPNGVTPQSKIVLKKGCQIPSYAYVQDETKLICYTLEEDVTFIKEGDVWVRQGEIADDTTPTLDYQNNYILSDLYQDGVPYSQGLKDGYVVIDNDTSDTGYLVSDSFSLSFDFSLNLGTQEISALGNYTTFAVVTATRGYNSSHAFGWRFYLYRPENPQGCVEFYAPRSDYNDGKNDGSIQLFESVNILFEKGKTYRITVGYKLIDKATGTVEAYVSIDDYVAKGTYTLGTNYMNYASYVNSIVFTSSAGVQNSVVLTNPNYNPNSLTLKNGDETVLTSNKNAVELPELTARNGQVFIGWTSDLSNLTDLYPAGYKMNAESNLTLYAVWMSFAMRDGAAVRKTDGADGLRFLTDVNGAEYTLGVEKGLIAEIGTILAPSSYLKNGRALTHELGNGYFVDVAVENWTSNTNETWTYAAAFINMGVDQYTRAFSARGYLKISYTTGAAYVYTAYDEEVNSRSIYYVANEAHKKDDTSNAVLGYVNAVADITVNASFIASKTDGAQGDYSVTTNFADGVITISVDKNVKAVLINGTRVVMGYAATIDIDNKLYEVSGYNLSGGGCNISFAISQGAAAIQKDYYVASLQEYVDRTDYTATHYAFVKATAEAAIAAINGSDDANAWTATYAKAIDVLTAVKTEKEVEKNVGSVALAAPVLTKGFGYYVSWSAVENADYYTVYDSNDYRDGVIVLANETLSYKTEVIGKHTVKVTAHSYYETYKSSAESAPIEAVEVKPVFSYKAMNDGLYKFSASTAKNTMGISQDIIDAAYDDDGEYFFYYDKNTNKWSANESDGTDWSSPEEFPAHAARLKAMGNNVILTQRDTASSYTSKDTWENSRLKYIMDTAWSMGMKVLVCDEVFYALSMSDGDSDGVATSKSQVTNAINTRNGFVDYVTHPAFYGFSLDDEPYGKYISPLSYTISALNDACKNLGVEPFFLSCLFQSEGGELLKEMYTTESDTKKYYDKWLAIDGVDGYLYVDIYTKHAMGQLTDRYNKSFSVVYGSNYLGGKYEFYQAITAHTQNNGVLTEQDMYMSLLYAAAHDVSGYSWFCYFPIVGETAGSIVGYDGNGYGNGVGNSAKQQSFYNAAKTAAYQFELIQGLLDGYDWQTRNVSGNLLTTTLSNGSQTATMHVNADVTQMSRTVNCTASGSVCYLIGYGVGTEEAPYQVVSGSVTLQPGQAVICMQ